MVTIQKYILHDSGIFLISWEEGEKEKEEKEKACWCSELEIQWIQDDWEYVQKKTQPI